MVSATVSGDVVDREVEDGTSAGRAAWFAERFDALAANVESFIRGKPDVVRTALVCLLAEGHLLIEDVPGTGKTSLAKAIAQSIDGAMQRIQFTPGPAALRRHRRAGLRPGKQEFVFHPGPVFANIVLADEINRASPKTQSALLEVMAERQVTVDCDPVPGAAAVHRHRHPEPGRARRAPTTCPRPSSTGS